MPAQTAVDGRSTFQPPLLHAAPVNSVSGPTEPVETSIPPALRPSGGVVLRRSTLALPATSQGSPGADTTGRGQRPEMQRSVPGLPAARSTPFHDGTVIAPPVQPTSTASTSGSSGLSPGFDTCTAAEAGGYGVHCAGEDAPSTPGSRNVTTDGVACEHLPMRKSVCGAPLLRDTYGRRCARARRGGRLERMGSRCPGRDD